MRLAIALATRNRPALLLDTLARTIPNISLPETKLTVMVDSDDAATIEALNTLNAISVVVNVKDREDTVAGKYNRILSEPADAYMVMVDHSPHLTHGFDKKILDAAALFPDGIGVIYNRLANASFPGLNVVTAKLAKQMGYIFPEYFPYWFIDHWLDDIARIIDRIAFADVAVDCSKKPMTQEMREPAWWATFFDAGYMFRREIAHNIVRLGEFQEQHWRKRILVSHHPLIEYRSKWINDSVRANSQVYSAASNLSLKDDRYQRIRAKAVEMIPRLLDDYGMDQTEASAYRNYLLPPTNIVNIKRA